MRDGAARNDLLPAGQRLGLGAAMRLDHADHHVDAVAPPRRPLGQHLERLADAGSGTQEDLSRPRPSAWAWRRSASGSGRAGSLSGIGDGGQRRAGGVERAVERQDVHARVAEQRPHRDRRDQRADPVERQAARGGDARRLRHRGGRRQVRVEAGAARRDQIGGQGAGDPGGPGGGDIRLHPVDQRLRRRAEVGAGRGHAVIALARRRGAGAEIAVAGEGLPDHGRPIACPAASRTRLPFAWAGNSSWPIPVIANG